jgi:hypothetical protein
MLLALARKRSQSRGYVDDIAQAYEESIRRQCCAWSCTPGDCGPSNIDSLLTVSLPGGSEKDDNFGPDPSSQTYLNLGMQSEIEAGDVLLVCSEWASTNMASILEG